MYSSFIGDINGTIPEEVLRYSVVTYLPFREIYLVQDRYPEEYQAALDETLNNEDRIYEPLLTALEFKDAELLDLVIEELPKFHSDFEYINEPLDIGEQRSLQEYGIGIGDPLINIYDYLLKIGDEDAIALILSTNGQTSNQEFNRWILGYEKLDYPFHSDNVVGIRTLLSDKVVSSIGDKLTWIYAVDLRDDSEDLPELIDAIYRLYRQRKYIPSGILQATGWKDEQNALNELARLSELELGI